MIKIIAGKKGKGKTKHLLDMVNTEVKNVHGNIVYLDKSGKHMYEDTSEFIGFIYGIISQDNDLEQIYLDSFLKISNLEGCDVTDALAELDTIGEKYHLTFVLSVSMDEEELPEYAKTKVVISL